MRRSKQYESKSKILSNVLEATKVFFFLSPPFPHPTQYHYLLITFPYYLKFCSSSSSSSSPFFFWLPLWCVSHLLKSKLVANYKAIDSLQECKNKTTNKLSNIISIAQTLCLSLCLSCFSYSVNNLHHLMLGGG